MTGDLMSDIGVITTRSLLVRGVAAPVPIRLARTAISLMLAH